MDPDLLHFVASKGYLEIASNLVEVGKFVFGHMFLSRSFFKILLEQYEKITSYDMHLNI